MDQLSFKCDCCDREFTSLVGLMRHAFKMHQVSSQETYVRVVLGGQIPTCACGCDEIPKYWGTDRGFSEFRPGHQSRVHNNWGHNPQAHENSRKTQLEMYANGELSVWNKGLSTETDERVASYGRMQSENFTDDRRLVRSERMRKYRLDGTIPSPKGETHGNWKGGVSAFQPLCRARLQSRWAFPKLKASNFTCQHCGKQRDLCVHHDDERFASILQRAIQIIGEPGDDPTACSEIAEWVVRYHLNNDVSGVVLCKGCHEKVHARTL